MGPNFVLSVVRNYLQLAIRIHVEMDSKRFKGALDIWLAESWALDEMDSLIRQKDMIDQEHISALSKLRQSVGPDYSDTIVSTKRAEYLRQLDDDIKARDSKHSKVDDLIELESSPTGKYWAEFRNLLTAADDAKEQYSRTLEYAKEHLIPTQFWSQVAQAEFWVDLRLPREDLSLRASVNLVNICRDAAFEFYQKRRHELFDYHQKRLAKVNEILGIQSATSVFSDALTSHTDLSGTSMASSDIESAEDIRGPFAPVKYTNFLNEGKEGVPIFGSELASGSGRLGKQILGTTNDLLSPPVPIFTPPIPEAGDILECMKCAFRLEEVCGDGSIYEALQAVINPPDGVYRVEKGWLLAFMLVNLPKRLIFLNEDRIRSFRTHLPRDQITFLFQKGTLEYDFFKFLWRHTNDVNIRLAASAITQAKGTERILSDIRSKWQIEYDLPLPSHRKWPSVDEGRSIHGHGIHGHGIHFGHRRRSSGSRSGF